MPDKHGRDLEQLGHNPADLEQPQRVYPVDDPGVENPHTHIEKPDGTVIDIGHKPGAPRPRPDDGPDHDQRGELTAPAQPSSADETPGPEEQYRRSNIVRPPYGGA